MRNPLTALADVATTIVHEQTNVSVLDPMARDARDCFQKQAAAIANLSSRIEDGSFGRAVRLLNEVDGHVIITGLGKSGLVGQKIAATLASTGTPSFFLHSAEAFHGDLGMVTAHDAVVLISYSGETREVAGLLPHLRARGIPTIGLAGRRDSTLAKGVDVFLDISVDRELCPNNLAPTNSTLTTLAMGDALAVSLMRLKGFGPEDFARCHPGGSLGKKLHERVCDSMLTGTLPAVPVEARVTDCVFALARATVPVVLVMDGEQVCGIIGEMELRRALTTDSGLDLPVEAIMNTQVPVIDETAHVTEAERRLAEEDLVALIALDCEGRVTGIFPGGSPR